jgi:serine/threonine protein kinase
MAFMTTRYLSGGSLQDLIAHSRESGALLVLDEILRIAKDVTTALAYIHACRILYLGLQPKNVLFDRWHNIRLVDFDTAVSLDDDHLIDLSHRLMVDYMAPELTDAGKADGRSDLYSLGATIYAMCEGWPPFSGTREQILAARRTNPPPCIARDDIPKALKDLVGCLLAPEPEQRPDSANEVVEGLERICAEAQTVAPERRGSRSLPEPDADELRESVRANAAEYDVGDIIDDRFKILDVLGRGGFSKVYRVLDDVEGEERALKLFDNVVGYEAVRREIGALRKIRHPNVVEVFWAGKTNVGDWYLITEFIDGESLDAFITGNKRLRDREAVDIALDLLHALVAFHPDSARLEELDAKRRDGDMSEAELHEWLNLNDKGLVHRDIKPLNVMLTRTGVKLLDFNIASRVGDRVLTQSGTPPYQRPDTDLTRWDVSTDLFAIGVILYELLCDGHHPYPNSKPLVAEPVNDPRTIRPDLNRDLAKFLLQACACPWP